MVSKLEREYLTAVAALGCIVCYNNGYEDTPACIHHICDLKGMSNRAEYWDTLPLCQIHHQDGDGTSKFKGALAFHRASEEWERSYSTQRELQAQVINMLPQSLIDRVEEDKRRRGF